MLQSQSSYTLRKVPVSSNERRPSANESKRIVHKDFVDYVSLDKFRRETTNKEQETYQTWKEKYDPWLIDEYRRMYASVGKKRDQPQENLVIPSKRTEWQQPADILPPISKRLSGQRRRRVLGAFPETESDKIGWRLLPQHAIDIYGSKASRIPPLPERYRFSSWPVESFS